jgi:hypothetical protein
MNNSKYAEKDIVKILETTILNQCDVYIKYDGGTQGLDYRRIKPLKWVNYPNKILANCGFSNCDKMFMINKIIEITLTKPDNYIDKNKEKRLINLTNPDKDVNDQLNVDDDVIEYIIVRRSQIDENGKLTSFKKIAEELNENHIQAPNNSTNWNYLQIKNICKQYE